MLVRQLENKSTFRGNVALTPFDPIKADNPNKGGEVIRGSAARSFASPGEEIRARALPTRQPGLAAVAIPSLPRRDYLPTVHG